MHLNIILIVYKYISPNCAKISFLNRCLSSSISFFNTCNGCLSAFIFTMKDTNFLTFASPLFSFHSSQWAVCIVGWQVATELMNTIVLGNQKVPKRIGQLFFCLNFFKLICQLHFNFSQWVDLKAPLERIYSFDILAQDNCLPKKTYSAVLI